MTFLFVLVGISALVFSFALSHSFGVYDPAIFCMIGWLTVVSAYYISYFVDHARIFILNRNYEAYIVRGDGTFWDGRKWGTEGQPRLYYNNFQVDETLKFLHQKYSLTVDELYVKVILPEVFFDRMEEEDESEDE